MSERGKGGDVVTIEELDRQGTYLAALVARLRSRAVTVEEGQRELTLQERVVAKARIRTLRAVAEEIDRDRAAIDKRRENLRAAARPTGPAVEDSAAWMTPLTGDRAIESAAELAEATGEPIDVAISRMLNEHNGGTAAEVAEITRRIKGPTPTEQFISDELADVRGNRVGPDVAAWRTFRNGEE